ncbi:hypothetical protein AXX12_13195 [Anaerosporomusa subterranea]|uniref:ABC transporter domain-containing protein n=1 Tax=Anaerosporomusa subterranea TaxID=1794912 RepID=A0A154BNN1_ANASB|nr:hypothetical protein [Anaerosporomusa subterranea]KYZ75128.1 hypothetical protein AXX12_13195 [Anaerosporomusa subterranea]
MLRVDGISKTFFAGTVNEKLALKNVSLEMKTGDFITVIGGNGAALRKPKLLLLDEHTAALDPKTAEKVLELTKNIVEENGLTTLMITHNMRDALRFGNRLLMLNDGEILLDIHGAEKSKMTVHDLLDAFEHSGGEDVSDRMLLS